MHDPSDPSHPLATSAETQPTAPVTAAAFLALYDEHAPHVLAFIASRVGNRHVAEDLLQFLWLKAWIVWHSQGAIAGNPRAWLFEVARNLVIDHARRLRPEPLLKNDLAEDRQSALLGDRLDSEELAALAECLAQLDEISRALMRGLLAGMRYAELCPSLGLSEAAAYKRVHYAKRVLAECVRGKLS